MAWQSDPLGRHQERWIEAGVPSGRVRDYGVENTDTIGGRSLVSVGAGAASLATAYENSTHASVGVSLPSSSEVRFGGVGVDGTAILAPPPSSMTPMRTPATNSATRWAPAAGYTPPAVTSRASSPIERRGISAGLALATVIAAFPMIVALAGGLMALAAGLDISDASRSDTVQSWDYEEMGIESSTTPAQDILGAGTATTEAGMAMAGIGSVGLILAIGMATGSNPCRVLTALWLIALTTYFLSQVGDLVTSDTVPYLAVVLAPPIIALIAMFTPESNRVFQDS